ncbi:hypothetical protein QQS21_000457 [Conoideocrella luteorostrata]|uniref:cellulase n=1 Tax=Conoideocrella luteorostrata TaxID=1105319 RepID=A0AAJ0D1R7_9HYPO|nr:hypothetical protein QQS21_000457 [Conoideocrella luteorostrata]
MRYILFLLAFASEALGHAGAYSQHRGQNWSGPSTSCTSGYACALNNDNVGQGLHRITVSGKHQSESVAAPAAATGTQNNLMRRGSAQKLKWLGMSESVAEFGKGKYPGVWGVDFRFPDVNSIGALINEGYNIFRIPFAMERMVYPSMTSSLSTDYLNNLTHIVEFITRQGKHVIIEPHNFGRYNINDDNAFTRSWKWMTECFNSHPDVFDIGAFGTFWRNLASAFHDNEKVIFDTNNEFHDIDQDLVLKLNQAAIDGIRASGATAQFIMVEGNSWSGAWKWASKNDNLKYLTDPQDKIIYQMHQYLDGDGSGSQDVCMTGTIGRERLLSATRWLRDNKKVGVLGEFAGGANPQCKQAIVGLLDHLQENSDVWLGALWWAAGPWWEGYMFSFEPPNGVAFKYYNDLLKTYLP